MFYHRAAGAQPSSSLAKKRDKHASLVLAGSSATTKNSFTTTTPVVCRKRLETEQDLNPDRAAGIRKTEKTGQQRSENEPKKSRRKNRIPDDGETGF